MEIPFKMNRNLTLFVLDFNETRSERPNRIWSFRYFIRLVSWVKRPLVSFSRFHMLSNLKAHIHRNSHL